MTLGKVAQLEYPPEVIVLATAEGNGGGFTKFWLLLKNLEVSTTVCQNAGGDTRFSNAALLLQT